MTTVRRLTCRSAALAVAGLVFAAGSLIPLAGWTTRRNPDACGSDKYHMDWEEEPFLSANPAKAGKLAVAWMQDWFRRDRCRLLNRRRGDVDQRRPKGTARTSNSIRKAIGGGGK
jgi:hypothetical protein